MSRFSRYATGVGFRLELTKAQINFLNLLIIDGNSMLALKLLNGDNTLSKISLYNKGLINFDEDAAHGAVLTPAGKQLMKLLRSAGCLKRNTNQKLF